MKWKEYSLDELIHIKHGYAFKGEFFSEEPTDDILLTPGNFAIGGGFKAQKLKYYNGEFPVDYILDENDVIVTMTDLSKEADTLGFSAKVPAWYGKRFLHNQRIGLVKLKTDDFDKDYLYWLMRTFSYQRFVANGATGATVKHTSPTKICQYKFIAPDDKTTQRKIASILSAYDDLIENNLKRIKLLEEKAFLRYKQIVRDEKMEVEDKLENLIQTVKRKAKIPKADYKEKGDFPIIDQSTDFIGGYTNEKEAVYADLPIIVFGDHTRILKYINFPFACGADGTQLVKPENPSVSVAYLFFELISCNLSNYHYARHFKFLKEQIIKLPSEKVMLEYKEETDKVFNLIQLLRLQNTKLREARDILLPKLMNGQIEV